MSDVPVGIFLSGGIDSSALVALLSQNEIRANTFSLVFKEQEYDEGQYSREVARRFRTEHHEIPVSAEDALAALPEALRAMDQPTIDGINTYLVSAKTRAAGVKVALTGLGADEMFAGYSNFRRVPKMEKLARQLGRLPRAARRPLAASMAVLGGKGDRRRKLAELAAGDDTLVHPYFLARELFNSTERDALDSVPIPRIAARAGSRIARIGCGEQVARFREPRVVLRIHFLYAQHSAPRFRFHEHGARTRIARAFPRSRTGRSVFRIPGETKLNGSSPKSLLLASLGVALPPEIVNRPKRGFTLPFERWLRGEMRETVEASL